MISPYFLVLLFLLSSSSFSFALGPSLSPSNNQRQYGFSLSTFNPDGRLLQLDYALKSASLGSPTVAVLSSADSLKPSCGVVVAPVRLPSRLYRRSLYPRILSLGPATLLSVSGSTPDLALLHSHLTSFLSCHGDSPPPLPTLLSSLSSFLHSYTSFPGVRPLSLDLLLLHLPSSTLSNPSPRPTLHAINALGDVSELSSHGVSGDGGFAGSGNGATTDDIPALLTTAAAAASSSNSDLCRAACVRTLRSMLSERRLSSDRRPSPSSSARSQLVGGGSLKTELSSSSENETTEFDTTLVRSFLCGTLAVEGGEVKYYMDSLREPVGQ